jgi:XTP/dITP diphosphohydrolase
MRKLTGKIVIATHNAGKLQEMRELLAPYGLLATSAGELGLPEPEENGFMFSENAAIKALASARASGLPTIADDSGLCVDALDGAPGIFTADWAGNPRDFTVAFGRVARELTLRDVDPNGAKAHFVSALVVAWPDGETALFEGRVFGTIAWPPRGSNGHGYDPFFQPDGETKTFGELPPEAKNGLSHRSRAFAKLKASLLKDAS